VCEHVVEGVATAQPASKIPFVAPEEVCERPEPEAILALNQHRDSLEPVAIVKGMKRAKKQHHYCFCRCTDENWDDDDSKGVLRGCISGKKCPLHPCYFHENCLYEIIGTHPKAVKFFFQRDEKGQWICPYCKIVALNACH